MAGGPLSVVRSPWLAEETAAMESKDDPVHNILPRPEAEAEPAKDPPELDDEEQPSAPHPELTAFVTKYSAVLSALGI